MVGFLKDELRTVDKKDKPHVIMCPPFPYLLLQRQYLGNFAAFYRQNGGFKLSHGIGLDKETVWAEYIQYLKGPGEVFELFDLDYETFDGTIPPFAFSSFIDTMDVYYSDVDTADACQVRVVLMDELQSTVHLVNGHVRLSTKGNNSGNGLTDVFNSHSNWLFMLVAFYLNWTTTVGSEPSVQDWRTNVRLLTYGDDVIIGVTRWCANFFNRVTIARSLSKFGLKLTDAAKSKEMAPTGPNEDVTFLKSKFVTDGNGLVRAPMPKQVVFRLCNWLKKKFTHDWVTRVQIYEAALNFAAHHEDGFGNELKAQLTNSLTGSPCLSQVTTALNESAQRRRVFALQRSFRESCEAGDEWSFVPY